MALLEVKLSRSNRMYRPPDVIDGVVSISNASSLSHQGVRVTALGSVTIQPSMKSVGVIESLYSSVKPVILLKETRCLAAAGKLPVGKSEFAFQIPLEGITLHETYHGVYINIEYSITVEVSRGYLTKPLVAKVEVMVEGPRGGMSNFQPHFVSFYITQDTQKHVLLSQLRSGGFKIVGRIATQCSLSKPLTGELTVEHSRTPIKSIDLHIIRVETVVLSDKMAVERTAIQSTQIADGDVCRGLSLPIYVILPRLLTCPVLLTSSFSIEFEVTVTVLFDVKTSAQDNDSQQAVASETLPLKLLRL